MVKSIIRWSVILSIFFYIILVYMHVVVTYGNDPANRGIIYNVKHAMVLFLLGVAVFNLKSNEEKDD